MDQKKEKINTFVDKALLAAIPFLGMLYIRLTAATSKITEHNRHIADNLIKEGKNFIFAFWHGRQFFLGYIRRNDKIKVMISESRDGEYIARVIKYFGMDTVRGSSSKGGVKALAQAIRSLKSGYIAGITPDGPKGPPLKAQMGALMLAAKTGCPIIPLAFGARRKKLMSSWDSYLIPLPFNRIAAAYGEPIYISETDNLAEKAVYLEEKLNETTKIADIIAG